MKTKIIAIVMAVIMAASVGAYFFTKGDSPEKDNSEKPQQTFSLAGSNYTSMLAPAGDAGRVFLPTDKAGLYYTMTLDNKVEFFTFTQGAFQPAPYEVKKTSVKLNASQISIPVNITYVEADGLIVGYGLFTSNMDSSVKIYSYAFVKIARKPTGFGEGYFLLADFDKSGFYKADKTFSEIYSYKIGDASVSTALSQNTRLIDINGTFRQDWSMLTDEFMKSIGDKNYFMSSRYYTTDETGTRTDIMVYSNAYRPSIVAKDILGTWFFVNSDGMHYLKKTDDGFKSVCVSGDDTKEIAKFSGGLENYLRCRNYIVNKETGEMTNLLTGDVINFKGIDISKAVIFELNDYATAAVFACPGELNESGAPMQKVIYYSATAGKKTFIEPMLYEEDAGFIWVDDNHVMSVRAYSDNGEYIGSVIYTVG